MNGFTLHPIAVVRSPFKEKFAAPRQSGLAPTISARIEFLPEYATAEAVRDLDQFSHIWLIFIFHQHLDQGWHPTVRPPRLGGNRRVGVFASRSPYRPNPVGLSAVKLVSVSTTDGEMWLEVEGADLIDGTPIIDIKPYLPYADSFPRAKGGFAEQAPEVRLDIVFESAARQQLEYYFPQTPHLETILRETLCLDPRPAYRLEKEDTNCYGCHLDRYNIRWRVEQKLLIITDISESEPLT